MLYYINNILYIIINNNIIYYINNILLLYNIIELILKIYIIVSCRTTKIFMVIFDVRTIKK